MLVLIGGLAGWIFWLRWLKRKKHAFTAAMATQRQAHAVQMCHTSMNNVVPGPLKFANEKFTGDREKGMLLTGTVDAIKPQGGPMRASFKCTVTWDGDVAEAKTKLSTDDPDFQKEIGALSTDHEDNPGRPA